MDVNVASRFYVGVDGVFLITQSDSAKETPEESL